MRVVINIAVFMLFLISAVSAATYERTTTETYSAPAPWCDTHKCPGHKEFDEMDTIGKPYDGKEWANYKAENSYTGKIDRKVLVSGMSLEAAANPDDTSKVLVSKPRVVKERTSEPEIIYIAKAEDSVVTVKEPTVEAKVWLEDEDTGETTSPKSCSYEGDTLTCNAF